MIYISIKRFFVAFQAPQNDSVKLQNDIQPILITRKAFIKNLIILMKCKIINKMWFCFFYNVFINFLY